MLEIILGVFLILHGLVHLLYAGHSLGLFTLQEGLSWPDGSWAFSRLIGDQRTGLLGGFAFTLAAVGFVVGGIGFLAGFGWWQPVLTTSAVYAIVITILFWDGTFRKLADQGGAGLLIDAAILAWLFW